MRPKADKPVFVHVGYGRTGTTWLQERVFSRAEGLDYWGKSRAGFPRWLLEINYLDDQAFETERDRLAQLIAQRLQASAGVALVSSEAFTNQGVITAQAGRIKDLFPRARIILTIRHPLDLLESFYRMTVVRDGGWRDLESSLDWARTPLALHKRRPIFLPDLFFDEVIGLYRRLFGRERVLVLQYETLVRSPAAFLAELGRFIGLDLSHLADQAVHRDNPGPDWPTLERRRLENLLAQVDRFGRPGRPLEGGLRAELENYFREKCSMYFPEANPEED